PPFELWSTDNLVEVIEVRHFELVIAFSELLPFSEEYRVLLGRYQETTVRSGHGPELAESLSEERVPEVSPLAREVGLNEWNQDFFGKVLRVGRSRVIIDDPYSFMFLLLVIVQSPIVHKFDLLARLWVVIDIERMDILF